MWPKVFCKDCCYSCETNGKRLKMVYTYIYIYDHWPTWGRYDYCKRYTNSDWSTETSNQITFWSVAQGRARQERYSWSTLVWPSRIGTQRQESTLQTANGIACQARHATWASVPISAEVCWGIQREREGRNEGADENLYISEQSRRDDLESLGYVLLYFLKGALPWQGIKAPNEEAKYERIAQIKQETPISVLTSGLPGKIYHGILLKGMLAAQSIYALQLNSVYFFTMLEIFDSTRLPTMIFAISFSTKHWIG